MCTKKNITLKKSQLLTKRVLIFREMLYFDQEVVPFRTCFCTADFPLPDPSLEFSCFLTEALTYLDANQSIQYVSSDSGSSEGKTIQEH